MKLELHSRLVEPLHSSRCLIALGLCFLLIPISEISSKALCYVLWCCGAMLLFLLFGLINLKPGSS
jgi:hypothetical protein